jgi:hypothetical protein
MRQEQDEHRRGDGHGDLLVERPDHVLLVERPGPVRHTEGRRDVVLLGHEQADQQQQDARLPVRLRDDDGNVLHDHDNEHIYVEKVTDGYVAITTFEGERVLLSETFVRANGVKACRAIRPSKTPAFQPQHPDPFYKLVYTDEEIAADAFWRQMCAAAGHARRRQESATHAASQPRTGHPARQEALQIAASIAAQNPTLGPNPLSERVVDRLADRGWTGKSLPSPRTIRRWMVEAAG